MIVKRMRCSKAIEQACDGARINCPHYHQHDITDDCETPSVCSRLNGASNREVECVFEVGVFRKSTKKKRTRRRKKKPNVKRKIKIKKTKASGDGRKDGERKNKRIRVVRKRT